ncbi:hypothetical protein FBU30_008738 [Linnemannia zychae]|nr:hypothetical protein FBU30_008738 [Linnemannia zychae]
MKTTVLLSLSTALSTIASVSAAVTVGANKDVTNSCRILKQESTLCPSIQYLTSIRSIQRAEKHIQDQIDAIPTELNGLQAPCIQVLQEALCLLEFPKCNGQTTQILPVCQAVRERVEKICSEPFESLRDEAIVDNNDYSRENTSMMLNRIRNMLFSKTWVASNRWADEDAVPGIDCVSWDDHGIGSAPIDNVYIINDLVDESSVDDNTDTADMDEEYEDVEPKAEEKALPRERNVLTVEAQDTLVRSALETRHLNRRERSSKKHHHHHHKVQKWGNMPLQERSTYRSNNANDEAIVVVSQIAVRSDNPSTQGTYVISKDGPQSSNAKPVSIVHKVDQSNTLFHENVGHSETNGGGGESQRVLIQSGSSTETVDPAKSVENLGKAGEGHPVDEKTTEEGQAQPTKQTVLIAAVPILLVMGAIAGFTIYRRYYENSFNQGGRNDTRDDHPDGYHQRDLPIRKGSPIHFDRTFLNTMHSPPPTATYLHDPDSPSRIHHQHSPSSIAAGNNLKRPMPSAGSNGKNRFQELSRSYDFSAGLRSIKNALTRSNNNSRDSALNQSSSSLNGGNGSSGSLSGRPSGQFSSAFGAGGHSIAKIGSHPGLNALERQQLQAQFGNNMSSSSSSAAARFPNASNLNGQQEHSIVWGQYSANDEHDGYQDASSALASNLGATRRSGSTNSLSMLNSRGKYSHHHNRQRSSDRQYQQHASSNSPRDSIGDYLSPDSPSMLTREELMRRRDLYSEGYTFGSENGSQADDVHSGTDLLLFDARDHIFDMAGSEKIVAASAQMAEEEMDMYLEMEKEESPFVIDDYNTMNPSPYEPKVLNRQMIERRQSIQKTASMRKKEISEKIVTVTTSTATTLSVSASHNDDSVEKESAAAKKSQSKKDRRKMAKQAKKQQQKAVTAATVTAASEGKTEQEFDEKRAMEKEEEEEAAAIVAGGAVTDTEAEQQTHVLGCDSPDWKE